MCRTIKAYKQKFRKFKLSTVKLTVNPQKFFKYSFIYFIFFLLLSLEVNLIIFFSLQYVTFYCGMRLNLSDYKHVKISFFQGSYQQMLSRGYV